MDYQTFNSQHPSFGGPFPTLPGTPAHLGQPTHSPQQQQQQQYADPHGRFLQSSPAPFPYGQQFANGTPQAFPTMSGGLPNGGLMQPGGGLSQSQLQQARVALHNQQQQQAQHQHQHPSPSPYSAAAFAQGIQSPVNPQFLNRQTASPSVGNHASPYANHMAQSPALPSNAQQQVSNASSQPQVSQQMQQMQQQPPQTPVKTQPASPLSPSTKARAEEQLRLLLEINTLLLQEICLCYEQGKGGAIGVIPGNDVKPDSAKPQVPSREYTDYMRRLQANLAFLAQSVEGKRQAPGPVIMSPPVSPPAPDELVQLYVKLQAFSPGWKGQALPVKPPTGQPQQQRPGSLSGVLPSQNAGQSNAAQQQMGVPGQQMPKTENQAQGHNMQQPQQQQQQMNQQSM